MTGVRLWVTIALLLALMCHETKAQSSAVLKIGLHYSAPWAYADTKGNLTGIDYRIVKRIFTDAGYKVDIDIFSHNRMVKKFKDKELDFASPMAHDTPGAHYTTEYLPFHDVAATHPDYHVYVSKLRDLSGKKIVAYQGARMVLGEPFAKVVRSAHYMEMADRKRQIDLLMHNRVEVVIGDRYVLQYYASKYHGPNKLIINDIFPQITYPAAAWRADVVKAFNQGLKALRDSGELKDIYRQPLP